MCKVETEYEQMTMIEKVARALHSGIWEGKGCQCEGCKNYNYNQQNYAKHQAKASIEAMREPSEAMIEAGCNDPSAAVGYVAEPDSIYRAMIDAALKE